MEKIKYILLVFWIVTYLSVTAQISYVHKDVLRTQATLSPSYTFADAKSFFYLHGNLEWYIENNISVSGDGYYFLGKLSSDSSSFNFNHAIFFGANKHFIKNNNDIYIGFQPGIAIIQLKDTYNKNVTGVNPLASVTLGYNFYISAFFHFFIQTRFTYGENNFAYHKDLSDIRLSAGLGFNLSCLKSTK